MSEPPNPEVAVFAAALELPLDQRGAYLDQACAGDAALRRQVEALLRVHDDAGNFFDKLSSVAQATPAEGPMPDPSGTNRIPGIPAEKAGDRIGRYKLLQQIGEGGCGVVYMAEQEEPLRRRVALKLIKLGMDTKSVIARFEAERQALALMDHPNIAKVLEAGATETGRPYFVMELVRGIKITDYCDENNLSTAARLELFVLVCQAIQHAHQKGIIHRDIKPSNILVADHDGTPVPKIIDFGIAKATTDQRLTDKTLFTAFEQFIGTPAYMSPEQAKLSGLDIDTRSDIYSLGVLLYELLTGNTPFEAKRLLEMGLDEIRRIIREEEPPRPSTRLHTLNAAEQTTVAKHRRCEPPKLFGIICGDLDWIVMKCLEKDRGRRYETANGLAADVQRHLKSEPVVACPPDNLYRLHKLVRRNRLAVFSGVLVTLSLVMGITLSIWQAVRATRAEREQRLLRQQAEAGRAAEAALRKIDDLRVQVANARVFFDAGKYDEAEKTLQEIPSSGQPEPEHAALLRLLASQRADLGQWKEAAADFSAVMRFDASDSPDTIGLDFLRCGPVLIESGETNQYRQFVRETIARFAGTSDPIMAERVCKICLLLPAAEETLRQLGAFYAVTTNKLNEFTDLDAKRWACVSLAIFEYRRGEFAKAVDWSSITLTGNFDAYLAVAHVIRAMSLQQLAQGTASRADFVQGNEAINAAVTKTSASYGIGIVFFDWICGRILQREAAANFWPELAKESSLKQLKNSNDFLILGHSEWDNANMLRQKGQLQQAEKVLREAVEVFEKGAIEYPGEPILRQELGKSQCLLGDLLAELGRHDEAEREYRAAIGLYLALKTAATKNAFYCQEEAYTTWALAELLERAGQLDKAEAKYREAIALHEKASATFPTEAVFTERLGTLKVRLVELLSRRGKLTEANSMFHDVAEHGSASDLNELAWFLATSGDLNLRAGTNAVVFAERAVAATNQKNVSYLDTLAAACAEAGQFEKAIGVGKEAIAISPSEQERKELASRLKLYQNNLSYRDDGELAQLAMVRLRDGKFAEAEQPARECLTIREKKIPDDWRTFNAKSMLGGSLLGQKKYIEAEPLLLSGYEGMKQREVNIPPEGKARLNETLQRLAQLYDATKRPEQAVEWRKKLAELEKDKK